MGKLLFVGLFVAAMTVCAQAGEVTVKVADKLVISGYTQAQWLYRNDLPDSLVNSTFYIRRARVRLAGEITKQTKGELEVDFASSKIVKDAVLAILPTETFTIQAGQFKRPFSQEELFSSSATPVMDLGLTNTLATTRLGYSGRSQGLMAVAGRKEGKLEAMAGLFTGAGEADVAAGDKFLGRQTDINNRGKDWAARVGTTMGGPTKLHLAVNGSSRSVGGNFTGGAGDVHKAGTFTAWGGDAELKHGPITVWAEGMTGDNFSSFTDTISSYSVPTFFGWHVAGNFQLPISGEHLISAWQLEGRFEMFDPDTDVSDDAQSLLTGGAALFLGKNMRWRTDAEWTTYESGAGSTLRLMSELQAKI